MNQNISVDWSRTERIIFRFLFCYLLFYFLFLSDVFVRIGIPLIEYIHAPFKYFSDGFIGLVNRLFIHEKYDANIYTGLADTSWFVIASLTYLIISFLVATVWTYVDKRKSYNRIFLYFQTYSRYYVAFVLFFYALEKLFGNQFPDRPPEDLIQWLGNIGPQGLMWTFMGASKSYNIFGGIMEIAPGILLLFKRTQSVGALIAMAVLTNVLLLDIGYDVLVKALASHLILISFFILILDIKRIFGFFFLKQNTSLTIIPAEVSFFKYKWIRHSFKIIIIAFVVFKIIQQEASYSEDNSKTYLGGLEGVYETKEFYRNSQKIPLIITDTTLWRRIAINKWGYITIQFMNDSTFKYSSQGDTSTKTIELNTEYDSTYKSKLHFSIINHGEYLFEGLYKGDSIRIVSKKINLKNLPLLKDKGKIKKWVWW
jgi:hypothetical protein